MTMPQRLAANPILVFALTGRIGAGVSYVRDKLEQGLRTYGYDVVIIDVTAVFLIKLYPDMVAKRTEEEVVEKEFNTPDMIAQRTEEEFEKEFNTPPKRVAELQRRGNHLRDVYGDDIISKLCVSEGISAEIKSQSTSPQRRIAFLIDSLKRPEEVNLLREVFRDAFTMVAVVASDNKRRERLMHRKRYDRATFDSLSGEDAHQNTSHGQEASETILKADYFLANNFDTKDSIEPETSRLLRLIFRLGIESPTMDEFGMHVAAEAAARSACLSKQVGAAIFSSDGSVLATGHNDVPQFGGGLYTGGSNDKRCWALGAKCYNDEEKRVIGDKLLEQLSALPKIKDDPELQSEIRLILGSSRIKSLIEFSRAVHAEMDALLTIARSAKPGLVGATLYSSTYPCHNCAKHIIAAGIKRVVYLNPYEKSLAQTLHPDTISDPSDPGRSAPSGASGANKVLFDTYCGVAPRRYNVFFESRTERKKNGLFIDLDRKRIGIMPFGAQSDDELFERIEKVAAAVDDASQRITTLQGSPPGLGASDQ